MVQRLVPRQTVTAAASSAFYGANCYTVDYTAIDSCYASFLANEPSCYNYYTDNNCCTSWLNWEVPYFNCLQTGYGSCFDFGSFASSVSDYLPCYTNNPFASPQSVDAQTTATPVPALILESISTGPPTATPIHSSIPAYSDQGSLLQGYCSTPDYVLLDGPTAYWAPAIGCAGAKTDCCPYSVQGAVSTTVITVVSTVTVDVGPGGTSLGDYAGLAAYPTPVSSNLATLAHCPGDYVSISGRCCPSGYQLWNAPLGGQIPCYSSLSNNLVPPAVPVTNYAQQLPVTGNFSGVASSSQPASVSQKPTSAIVNVIYAVPFPVQPSSSGLSTGAKAGIGVGAAVAGIVIIVLAVLLCLKTRKHKKDNQARTAMQQTSGPAPNGQSQVQNGTTEGLPPYTNWQQTELQNGNNPQMAQTSNNFIQQEQNGYFQPPQQYGQQPGQPIQQGLAAPMGHYPQQQQIHVQQPAQYPSPGASTLSPQATGSDGYGHQTGYAGTISSAGSPPPQEGFGHQSGYPAPVAELSPNSTGYGAPSSTFITPSTTGSQAPLQSHGYQNSYNPAQIDTQHSMPQELNSQTGYSAPVNELHNPEAQEMHTHNPPGELHA